MACTLHGGVAEWLKAPLSKSGIWETVSGVRISPPPQIILKNGKIQELKK
jgi:hypothetical protein